MNICTVQMTYMYGNSYCIFLELLSEEADSRNSRLRKVIYVLVYHISRRIDWKESFVSYTAYFDLGRIFCFIE